MKKWMVAIPYLTNVSKILFQHAIDKLLTYSTISFHMKSLKSGILYLRYISIWTSEWLLHWLAKLLRLLLQEYWERTQYNLLHHYGKQNPWLAVCKSDSLAFRSGAMGPLGDDREAECTTIHFSMMSVPRFNQSNSDLAFHVFGFCA